MGKWAPFIPRSVLGRMATKLRKNPDELRDHLLPIVPSADQVILERDEVADALRADQLEAFRQGAAGAAAERLLLVRCAPRSAPDPSALPLAPREGLSVSTTSERAHWCRTGQRRDVIPVSRVRHPVGTVDEVPRISAFYGIIIAMYFGDRPPPHFHAKYGEYEAQVEIATGEVLNGELPRRARALVEEWTDLHRAELMEDWERAVRQEPLRRIEPLP